LAKSFKDLFGTLFSQRLWLKKNGFPLQVQEAAVNSLKTNKLLEKRLLERGSFEIRTPMTFEFFVFIGLITPYQPTFSLRSRKNI
jgi:hypothetical protein